MLIEVQQCDGYSVALIGGPGGAAAAERFTRRVRTLTQAPVNAYLDPTARPKKVWCVQALGVPGAKLMECWLTMFDTPGTAVIEEQLAAGTR